MQICGMKRLGTKSVRTDLMNGAGREDHTGAVLPHLRRYSQKVSSPEKELTVFMVEHRLNMELDLQSLFGLHVHSCTHWAETSHPPEFGLINEGAIGQLR